MIVICDAVTTKAKHENKQHGILCMPKDGFKVGFH